MKEKAEGMLGWWSNLWEWLRLPTTVLTRMQGEGAVAPSLDVELEAELAVAFIDGLGLHAASDPKSWPEEEQRRLVTHYFRRLASNKGA